VYIREQQASRNVYIDLQEKMGVPDDAPKGTEAGPKNQPAIRGNTAGLLPCES
jgi:hypothetical protein